MTWRRERHPTPVVLGESHGQRSLVGDCPWGRKELGTAEQLTHTHTHTHTLTHTVLSPGDACEKHSCTHSKKKKRQIQKRARKQLKSLH